MATRARKRPAKERTKVAATLPTITNALQEILRLSGMSQTKVANELEISRVSLNRYLQGQSELRLRDFLQLAKLIGVDVEGLIRERLQALTGDRQGLYLGIGNDLELILSRMPKLSKQTYLGHVVAFLEIEKSRIPEAIQKRIRTEYKVTVG